MYCFNNSGKRVLVVAIGGGGDVATATMLSASLEEAGREVVLASVAWERYVYDPIPGPIRLEEIANPVKKGEHYVLIGESSYALRGGKRLVFQAAKIPKLVKKNIYIIDMWGGVKGYVEALKEISEEEGVDLVIGVDVGGDSLATGAEDNLWSPLADWVGLAAISRVGGVLAVHSPGSDGELDQQYVIQRIDYYARRGGLLCARAMNGRDADLLEKILSFVNSEASKISLLAARGARGIVEMRLGSRKVEITLFSLFTFFLDSVIVAESIQPVKEIVDTDTLDEARRVLNSMGVYTELDLEEDLYRQGIAPDKLDGRTLFETWVKGRKRVREQRLLN